MTVKFYIPTKTGTKEVSIFAVITCSRADRFKITTDEKVLPKHWNDRAQCVKSSLPESFAINTYLDDFKRNIVTIYRANREQGGSFTDFKERAQGKAEKKSLSSALDLFLKQYEQDWDAGTVAIYKSMALHLEPFKSLPFEQLGMLFFDEFRAHMQKKGLQDSSVHRYVSNLKTFLYWAEDRDYPVNKVFRKWTVNPHHKKPLSLSMDELNRLESAILPRQESIGRDFLCLEARTGQRISDLIRFDLKNLHDNKWVFNRKKGNAIKTKQVTVHFVGYCAPALDILKKHNFKMPSYSKASINRFIRDACKMVGINSLVTVETWKAKRVTVKEVPKWTLMTTHWGRRTFITHALQFMSHQEVMDLTGIDSPQTLKHYKAEGNEIVTQGHLIDMEAKLKAG